LEKRRTCTTTGKQGINTPRNQQLSEERKKKKQEIPRGQTPRNTSSRANREGKKKGHQKGEGHISCPNQKKNQPGKKAQKN